MFLSPSCVPDVSYRKDSVLDSPYGKAPDFYWNGEGHLGLCVLNGYSFIVLIFKCTFIPLLKALSIASF